MAKKQGGGYAVVIGADADPARLQRRKERDPQRKKKISS